MTLVEHLWPMRRAISFAFAGLIVCGVVAASSSPRSIYPALALARISILAERSDATVRSMTNEVTQPIERTLAGMTGLSRVRSRTVRGTAEITLEFDSKTNLQAALAWVRGRVEDADVGRLDRLVVERQTPALYPVFSFVVVPSTSVASDPVGRARLAEWVDDALLPRIQRIPDVFLAEARSGDRREYELTVNPEALAAAGVDLPAIAEQIRASTLVRGVGQYELDGQRLSVLVDAEVTDAREVLDLAIARPGQPPISLTNLGTLTETVADRTVIVTGSGVDAVAVNVFLRDGGDVTALSRAITRVLEDRGAKPPAGARFDVVYDQSRLVADAMGGVIDAFGVGTLLSIAVLYLFLGHARLTLISGLAIPISLALSYAAFPLFGETLNLMSLGGSAVGIGLVIDDAIVVVESVARRWALTAEGGRRATPAVVLGTRDVVGPVLTSSFATVLVFAPLLLLGGIVGQFVRSFALALTLGIIASAVVSLLALPLLLTARALVGTRVPRKPAWFTWIERGYASFVLTMLRHRLATLTICGLVLVPGPILASRLTTGFLPTIDEGGFILDYALPVGSNLTATDAACRTIESVLSTFPEIAAYSRRTGAEFGLFATEASTGDFLIGLTPRHSRSKSVFDVMRDLRERLERTLPHVDFELVQVIQDTLNDLVGAPRPIEVDVLGPNQKSLQRTARRIAAELANIPGIVEVAAGTSFGNPEIAWHLDPIAAARMQLTSEAVANSIALDSVGVVAARAREGNRFVDIRIRSPKIWGRHELEGSPILIVAGQPTPIPLDAIARRERRMVENELERENQVPVVRVTAGLDGTDLGTADARVRSTVGALELDPGVRVEFAGEIIDQRKSQRQFVVVFTLAASALFVALVTQFASIRLALVILAALPFAGLGATCALRLSGVPLNVSSSMGLVLLIGLVVKNGIMLVEHARRRPTGSLAARIVTAARVRVRPIVMTSATAILASLPLAFGSGAAADLQRPLAIVVAGGLTLSTVFTLLVVPLGLSFCGTRCLRPEQLDVE
jgi:multidrug efflux pump subunit AcrB